MPDLGKLKYWWMKVPGLNGYILERLAQERMAAHTDVLDIPSEFLLFSPNSSGGYRERSALTKSCVNGLMPAFVAIATKAGAKVAEVMDIDSIYHDEVAAQRCNLLGRLLTEHGSDKATDHDYHKLYSAILADRKGIRSILEVGMGSNNPGVVSSMGSGGRPGASLRAFRDFLPTAQIYGADIDESILFQEDRIKTFPVDQLNPEALTRLGELIPDSYFDLVIDDGLHAPDANINTLAFSLGKVAPGGWIVVEDIRVESISVWKLASALLPVSFRSYIFLAKNGVMFAAQRCTPDKQFFHLTKDFGDPQLGLN
jgi:hypothetical protein